MICKPSWPRCDRAVVICAAWPWSPPTTGTGWWTKGSKHSGDFGDAGHLAHLPRLGILPVGYIYPREECAVRDLLHKRGQLVRQRTTQILSMQNLMARNLAQSISGNTIKRWQEADIDAMSPLDGQKLALKANLAVMQCLEAQIKTLERSILAQVKLLEDYKALRSVSGIGEVLALTIALETGQIGRFATPGNFASYARTVDSRRESNGKKKGEGNANCGNKHLAWAFVEAAHFAVRYEPQIKRWYQRKCAKRFADQHLGRIPPWMLVALQRAGADPTAS